MKTFVVLSILAFALKTKGDVTVGVSTVSYETKNMYILWFMHVLTFYFIPHLKFFKKCFNFQVMCNCGAPNTDNYNAFNAANADCTGYPHGSPGHGSCITNALGFVRFS